MVKNFEEIVYCDICKEKKVNDFYYYEILQSPFGPLKELHLQIDVCESCAGAMAGDFPQELLQDRYSAWEPPNNMKYILKMLRKERGFRPDDYQNY